MKAYLLIGLGSALGGMARHWLATLVTARAGSSFPWGTLAVNVVGSFLIGLLVSIAEERFSGKGGIQLLEFLAVGVLGGFTTFSAFSIQTVALLQESRPWHAAAYAASSMLLCIAAAWTGWHFGK